MPSVAVARPEHIISTIPIVRRARNSATTTTHAMEPEPGGRQDLALFEAAPRSIRRRFGISAVESIRATAGVWCEAPANDTAQDGTSLFQVRKALEFFGRPALSSNARLWEPFSRMRSIKRFGFWLTSTLLKYGLAPAVTCERRRQISWSQNSHTLRREKGTQLAMSIQ